MELKILITSDLVILIKLLGFQKTMKTIYPNHSTVMNLLTVKPLFWINPQY